MILQLEYIYNDHMSYIYQNGFHSNIPIPFVFHFWLNKDIPCLTGLSFSKTNKYYSFNCWKDFQDTASSLENFPHKVEFGTKKMMFMFNIIFSPNNHHACVTESSVDLNYYSLITRKSTDIISVVGKGISQVLHEVCM